MTTSTPTSATPRFIVGIHSDKSNYRMSNADAAGSHHDPGSGQTAFAVADGIGDWTWAETAALNAIRDALPVAVRRGALAGLLAAAQPVAQKWAAAGDDPLLQEQVGNAVMAVATPRADDCGGGWDIVWCGDVRAYVRSPDGQLLQWTVDHTDGQVLRERATTDTERELASQFDHVVTTHLATVTRTSLGSVNVPGPHDHGGHGRLLLTTDGVHKALPPSSIARAASLFRDPQVCAQRLVTAAIRAGSRDNATALVADRVP